MPAHVAARVAEALNDRGKPVRGSRVCVLGVAYKRDVGDCRESPGLALMDLLLRRGAEVCYHDPHVPALPRTRRHPHLAGGSRPLTSGLLQSQDAVVIVTDHSACDWAWVVGHAPLVIDTRNATRGVPAPPGKIVHA